MSKTTLKSALVELSLSGNSLREKLRSTDGEFATVLHEQLNAAEADITGSTIEKDAIQLIPYHAAAHYSVMPVRVEGSILHVSMVDPTDLDLIEELEFITGKRIKPLVASRTIIQKVIESTYSRKDRSGNGVEFSLKDENRVPEETRALRDACLRQAPQGSGLSRRDTLTPDLIKTSGRSPVVTLINQLIGNAISQHASDIHFESIEGGVRVRYRIDGVLQDVMNVSAYKKTEIISRLKIMASLDIAEKRRPQDGRISVQGEGRTIDIRVSTLPTAHGEKVVLRLLDKSHLRLDLTELGFDKDKLEAFKKAIKLPYGMILVTGPTGSGKTTTLYGGLNFIRSPEINISTIEDPIEYHLDGVNQAQVKPDIGFTFAHALRTMLRQDPNVIMVGEIRDRETADIAVRAALTGHLVLSTLHTNDAASAITRLQDMGLEPFLLSSSISMVIAQRLVRRICSECREEAAATPEQLQELGLTGQSPVFYRGRGCVQCNHTGYKGRIAIYEVLNVDEEIKEQINRKATSFEIKNLAQRKGMTSLHQDAVAKLKAGVITVQEVLRETTLG
jgi:type IV pilus assembly protein PilB